MELQVLNAQGEATSTVPAPAAVFGREFNEALVYQLVAAYQANARQGTRAQKDRQMHKYGYMDIEFRPKEIAKYSD